MSSKKASELTAVDLACKEYDGLRDELRQRSLQRNALVPVAGVAITVLAGIVRPDGSTISWVLGATLGSIVILSGLISWFANGRAMGRLSRRIAEIERYLNTAAGEQVLLWETRLNAHRGRFRRFVFGNWPSDT